MIVILSMVTAATIPLMAPVTGERKVRESARLLASVLAQAQSRALTTGRPAGVWIERLAKGPNDFVDRANQSVDLFLCEVPPLYSGPTQYSTCTVAPDGTVDMDPIPQGWVHIGDRIRFNYRGPVYRIRGGGTRTGPDSTFAYPNDGSLTGRNMAIDLLPASSAPPFTAPVPYQIYRQPVKTADEPVTFPVGAMVDLGFSGVGAGMEFAVPVNAPAGTSPSATPSAAATGVPHRPVLVMFGPSGNLDSVYFGHRPRGFSTPQYESYKLITPVYLLIGQRNADDATAPLNYINQENVWVAVNPQSGLVTTSEVAINKDDVSTMGTVDWTSPAQVATLMNASRRFARTAQNMGGR